MRPGLTKEAKCRFFLNLGRMIFRNTPSVYRKGETILLTIKNGFPLQCFSLFVKALRFPAFPGA